VSFTSEQIRILMRNARCEWNCPIRLQITAGAGCTVLEIFDRDAQQLSVPIQRILLQTLLPSGLQSARKLVIS
jgi:hypothetical protein